MIVHFKLTSLGFTLQRWWNRRLLSNGGGLKAAGEMNRQSFKVERKTITIKVEISEKRKSWEVSTSLEIDLAKWLLSRLIMCLKDGSRRVF